MALRVLFYVPDNRITHSYMPTLWPYVLKSLTPPGHSVTTLDGNVVRMDPKELSEYVRREKFDVVGIGGMTRTIHRSYAVADSIRAIGVPVVMGGPHVTEEPEEALEHADSVACGEADDLWPKMLSDFGAGKLQPIYRSTEKPSLEDYPRIPWEQTDFRQFKVLPQWASKVLKVFGWERFDVSISPVETGRGCPYRCDFCTVSPFFGEKIRFRTNESVIEELKLLKSLGRTLVFFVDDNFAINPRRAKSLMRAMIEADVRIPWVAQISMNLLRDQELLDLMKESRCVCVFIGLESVLPESLKEVSKTFNKPEEYSQIIGQLQRRGICCVTAFIMGIDADRPGVARKTWDVVRNWPPGFFPVFSQLTPLPGTPLYKSLRDQGRLEERHWLNYRPYGAAFTPKHMTPAELETEIRSAWTMAYSSEGIFRRVSRMKNMRFVSKLIYVFATLAFRGIYFRQMTVKSWLKLIWDNRRSVREVFSVGSFTHHDIAPVPEDAPPVQDASPSAIPGSGSL